MTPATDSHKKHITHISKRTVIYILPFGLTPRDIQIITFPQEKNLAQPNAQTSISETLIYKNIERLRVVQKITKNDKFSSAEVIVKFHCRISFSAHNHIPSPYNV